MVASLSPTRSFGRSSSAMSMHSMMIRRNVGDWLQNLWVFDSSNLLITYTANRTNLRRISLKLPVHEIEKRLFL